MHIFEVALLFICLFIALFTLYVLANDDFVLLRKNITITRVFDIALFTVSIGLFSARLFYVVFHFTSGFLNPLVFFLFPYFPGLSLAGGIIGGVLFLVLYCHARKVPMGRIFDIFSLALFSALPVGLLMQVLIIKKEFFSIILLFLGVAASVFFFIMFIRSFQKGNLKDGSISFLSLSIFSLITLIKAIFFLSKDDFLLIGIFIVSLGFLIKQESLLLRVKKIISGLATTKMI